MHKRLLLLAVFLLASCGASSPPSAGGPTLAGCPVFPADDYWNTPVDGLPPLARSSSYVAAIGADAGVHADFGSGLYEGSPIGIPFNLANAATPRNQVSFDYAGESDPGPYPIPPNPLIEGGSDRHLLVLERSSCKLYELYDATLTASGWHAGSGAVFDLRGYRMRPDGWTSADAAGLPILPGLVRYEEVAAGEIRHAIRFTAPRTQKAYLWPARHYASSDSDPDLPPMGLRLRLRADFDESGFGPQAQVVIRAMKKYGIVLADNGSAWFISGVPDERWDNDDLHQLGRIKGREFVAVDASRLMIEADSSRARQK